MSLDSDTQVCTNMEMDLVVTTALDSGLELLLEISSDLLRVDYDIAPRYETSHHPNVITDGF